MVWAMVVNPFLETQVRIQEHRGHHVITAGPYQLVRHPMYAGLLISVWGIPMVLGSWWSFAIIDLTCVLLVWRTYRDDETLRRELPVYEEYTTQTRQRLFSGIW